MFLFKVKVTRNCKFAQSTELRIRAIDEDHAERIAVLEALNTATDWTDELGSYVYGEEGMYIGVRETTIKIEETEYTIRQGSVASCMTVTYEKFEYKRLEKVTLNLIYLNEYKVATSPERNIQKYEDLPRIVRDEINSRYRVIFNTPLIKRDITVSHFKRNPITLPIEDKL